jgi:hypothetical protein
LYQGKITRDFEDRDGKIKTQKSKKISLPWKTNFTKTLVLPSRNSSVVVGGQIDSTQLSTHNIAVWQANV